jgi:hypothetical protein
MESKFNKIILNNLTQINCHSLSIAGVLQAYNWLIDCDIGGGYD